MHAPVPLRAAAAAFALAACTAAQAELRSVADSGFVVEIRHEPKVSTAALWQALTQLPRWWNSQHTWSGAASNMSLDLQAGGCWCERWGEGQSVMHGQVVWLRPGRLLRLDANLGPLQERATRGVLTIETLEAEGRTQLRWTYTVSGAPSAGLQQLAPLVDGVLAEQARRLVSYAETGRAE